MRRSDAFDDFYTATRERLLLETYALTGDLPASRTAVRDAFAAAWHHWRKVERLADQEEYVRPLAHGRALRRHSARPWHKDKGLAPEVAATHEALAKLSVADRKVLVLTMLTSLSLDGIARAAGVTRPEAERRLQSGWAQVAGQLDVPSTDVAARLGALHWQLSDTRWPRAHVLRRAGVARRRTHSVIGIAAAVAAVVASGTLVSTGGESRTTELREESILPGATFTPAAAPRVQSVAETGLLTPDQVGRFGNQLTWTERKTVVPLDDDAVVLPCQTAPTAGPGPLDAKARTFAGTERETTQKKVGRGKDQRTKRVTRRVRRMEVTELVELASDAPSARKAYAATRDWFARCVDPRTQLLDTARLRGVGDGATMFTLRSWRKRPATMSVGVARTGQLTVTTMARDTRSRPVAARTAATALAASVNRLCGTPGAGRCAGPPQLRGRAPLSAGPPLGMLAALDLPPVDGAKGPWVGTQARRARTNVAATRCDRASFTGKGVKRGLTRTFLFPANRKAVEFGLTQTAGIARAPEAFVEQVRDRIRKCDRAGFGTSATALEQRSSKREQLAVWDMEMEISDNRSVRFMMAIMRHGRAVSQIGFTPTSGMTMSREDFRAVVHRALERLRRYKGR